MKIGWGWKITLLYSGFVALILTLVIASSRQHFDLVSKNYYDAELAYQKVIEAGKNQSSLSAPLSIHADANNITIDFPAEFSNKTLAGNVEFYAPVDASWDRTFKLAATNNSIVIPRKSLRNTRYTIKISCEVDGKSYYQESDILLHS